MRASAPPNLVKAMTDYAITLRYFDARGRAQFLRYYLRARVPAFVDERVPLSADFAAWIELRGDRSRTGPFQKLPVLQLGDELVAEALVIAQVLHDRLGDKALLSTQDQLRHAMLTSSVYQDVMMPLGTLLWAENLFAGVDLAALAARTLERLQQQLAVLDRTLKEWRWLEHADRRVPMLADFMLWEELDVASRVFGPHLSLAPMPALASFYNGFAARGTCQALLEEHPCPITARPSEGDAILRLQSLLAAR